MKQKYAVEFANKFASVVHCPSVIIAPQLRVSKFLFYSGYARKFRKCKIKCKNLGAGRRAVLNLKAVRFYIEFFRLL